MNSDMGDASEQISPKVATNHPLDQFVALVKNSRGSACLDLIQQVLETPGVHVFGEFLHMSHVNEVGSESGTPELLIPNLPSINCS